ncbi:MAG TPA: hypothetical protein VLJ68_02785 [Chitinophagaceae bacterium]|nr:hypothetical protein [Chitinophagaceae bacterium]
MKKLFFVLQFTLFLLFNFFLLITAYQLLSAPGAMKRLGYNEPKYNNKEDYDPALSRLNTINKVSAYCDSLYAEKTYTDNTIKFEESYPILAANVVRQRFYHGYSLYGFSNNFMAMMLEHISTEGLSAIVIPDDILEYPYAACSQQSIVLMEILKRKGFSSRKVGFKGKKGGHFCYEVYYNGAWHFYDTDMEPDVAVLNAYNHPGIDYLSRNPNILLAAYHQYPKETVLDIFTHYSYGKVNTFAAPRAIIFQKITKVLSYFTWLLFLLLFIFARRKYLRYSRQHVRNNRIHFPRLQPGTASIYYPNYSA